jgi:hypothetical protein
MGKEYLYRLYSSVREQGLAESVSYTPVSRVYPPTRVVCDPVPAYLTRSVPIIGGDMRRLTPIRTTMSHSVEK